MLTQINRIKLLVYLLLICFYAIANISCSGDKKSEQDIKFEKHYDLGSKFYEERKFEEAIKEFEKAANINPQSADANFKIGRIYNGLRKFEESAKYYEKGLLINPEGSYYVFFHLGLNYYNTQKYDKAIETMQKAENLLTDEYSDSEYSLNFVLANSYYYKKDYQKAIKHFNHVLELQPDYEHGYIILSQSHIDVGNRAEAIEILDKGLKQRPNSLTIIEALSWLLSTSNSDELRDGKRALILGERAVDFTSGQNSNYLDTLAAAYAEVGKYEDAVKTEERAINILTDPTITPSVDDSIVLEYKERLSSYKANKPWRE